MRTREARILIIGSGGREHAIGWRLRQDGVVKLFFAPGNAGTMAIGTNLPMLDIKDNQAILEFVKKHPIDLVVIGPEDPLERGLVDVLRANGKLVIGPTAKAARLETNKHFARLIMKRANIPQPDFHVCYNKQRAEEQKELMGGLPLVLKASGLAAGKGAYVCHTPEEWDTAIEDIFQKGKFGVAGETVLVEQCLTGEELSFFVLCDGLDYQILGTAQDHKRLGDGDTGPNTGGMGAYSPTPFSTPEIIGEVETTIIQPLLKKMKNFGMPVTGFMYPQIMLVKNGDKLEPYVIEINMRMGDPETQVVLPLIKSNFCWLLRNAANGQLLKETIQFTGGFAATVVKSAGGYPGDYKKGEPIFGLDIPPKEGEIIFHAGTRENSAGIVTNGGRIIAATGLGETLKIALEKAYRRADEIEFNNSYCRRDIGQRGLAHLAEIGK